MICAQTHRALRARRRSSLHHPNMYEQHHRARSLTKAQVVEQPADVLGTHNVSNQSLLPVVIFDLDGTISFSSSSLLEELFAHCSAERPHTKLMKYCLKIFAGTLLTHEKTIGARTKEALLEASESAGVTLCAATGKARAMALNIFDQNGVLSESSFGGPGVFLQGLRVFGKEAEEVHMASLSREVVEYAFKHHFGTDIGVTAFCGDSCYTVSENGTSPHPLAVDTSVRYGEPYPNPVKSIESIMNAGPVNKIVLTAASVDEIDHVLRPELERTMPIGAVRTTAVPCTVELIPYGNSKEKGVEIMLERMGVHPQRAAAVGDGENDAALLRMCGKSAAVANAADATAAEAGIHLSRTNDEDGAAEALERLVFSRMRKT